MRKILVLAYMISPTKGSEYSVAWNYVTHMSKYCNLTVLYGASGEHMGDCEEMECFVTEKGMENVRFVCVKPNKWTDILNWCNRHGFMRYTFYFAYHSWQKSVYREARKLVQIENFDLVHFVGPIGYREPGFLWKLDLPYMWGPIGGSNSANTILQKHTPITARVKFTFRNFINRIQLRFMMRLHQALKRTDLLLTATTENQQNFEKILNKKSFYLPENSIATEIMLEKSKFDNPNRYHFVIMGSLVPGKAVHIALEAMVRMNSLEKFHLDVVGDGPTKPILQQYAAQNGLLGNITWHGRLPRIKAVEIFRMTHAHIITSLHEGNPTTIWEAMSYGVPTISFDHCGMHDTICEKCGIKIPITTYEQCVSELANQMQNLIDNPQLFIKLAEGTLQCASKNTWEIREKFLLECYEKTIVNYNRKGVL
jgi:glycosyltransferase involved in cell wall biosynthesis